MYGPTCTDVYVPTSSRSEYPERLAYLLRSRCVWVIPLQMYNAQTHTEIRWLCSLTYANPNILHSHTTVSAQFKCGDRRAISQSRLINKTSGVVSHGQMTLLGVVCMHLHFNSILQARDCTHTEPTQFTTTTFWEISMCLYSFNKLYILSYYCIQLFVRCVYLVTILYYMYSVFICNCL
jgi:hypothetical protein